MPASRYLLLIAGILGLLAMFQPMIGLGRRPLRAELSAYDLSFGLEKTHFALDMKLPGFATKRVPADVLQTREDIKIVADASRGAALGYVPAILLLALGALCIWRKRTPRPIAIASGFLGLLSIGAWAGVRFAIIYGKDEEPALARLGFEALWGAHVLLIAGALGVIAAITAFTEPAAPRTTTRGT